MFYSPFFFITFYDIIIYLVGSLDPKIDTIDANVDKVLGLVHENLVVENTFDSTNKHTGYTAYMYDSKTNTDLHDKSTGLLNTYTMTVTYDVDNNPTEVSVVKE